MSLRRERVRWQDKEERKRDEQREREGEEQREREEKERRMRRARERQTERQSARDACVPSKTPVSHETRGVLTAQTGAF